jgi:hypothetical protein
MFHSAIFISPTCSHHPPKPPLFFFFLKSWVCAFLETVAKPFLLGRPTLQKTLLAITDESSTEGKGNSYN